MPGICKNTENVARNFHPAAGQRGNIDLGHKNSVEVFYLCTGHVLLFDEKQYYELFAGDAIFIPEELPHTLINIGDDTAVLVWAGAPGE